ncbi:hypothetical protein U1839_18990 [Sphingomonas sp. RT2P30]|uniref:hypothetical protein n=1 Tax=Parasphingomonas halimpatiens TaxID=3096162 RepID=UPI002FC81784
MPSMRRFWVEVDSRVRSAARLVVAGTNAVPRAEYEDLAQLTMLDLHRFVAGKLSEEPDIGLGELQRQVFAFGATCLNHNFLDLVRKSRRRQIRDIELAGNSNEIEGFADFSRRRGSTPEERQIALDWIRRLRERSKSVRFQAILDALEEVTVEELEGVTPKDITLLAKVSSNDIHKFRQLVSEFDRVTETGGK